MNRRLPPFTAIRAFEAAARHLSFKDAADELCVTPSAISHQIRALEEFLATALFVRDGNRLALTQTGRSYVGKLTDLLDGLDASTRAARAGPRRALRVLSTPGFAARWLVPRLDRFEGCRDIRLRVVEGAPSTDFTRNDADIAIQWATDPTPGVITEPLMRSGRYPVISPALLARESIQRPADLLRLTLLRDEVMDAWEEWFHAAGVDDPDLPSGPRLPHCELASTAAERGQGVALGYDAILRDTIAAGSLVRLFETVTLPITIYSVAYPEHRAAEPEIVAFRDWIFREAAADGVVPSAASVAAE